MGILRWLDPITDSLWLRALTGGILVILLIAGTLAHRPTRLPGPLTADERARKQLSWAARWAVNLMMMLLALTSAIAIFLLLSPPRRPVDLVLSSRLRPPQAPSPSLAASDRPRLDLGPVADAALAECRRQGARDWVTNGPAERAAVRRALLDTLKTASAPELAGGAEAQVDLCNDLPAWLVLSVEISVVQASIRQHNTTAVKVAPGPGKNSGEGWPLAATLLSTERTPVSCVDALSAPSENFTVLRLTGARLEGTSAQLRAWAVIHGRFSPNATLPARIGFRLSTGSPPADVQSVDLTPFMLRPEPAAVESRVVLLRFPVPTQFDPVQLTSTEAALTLSDETGNCTVPVHILSRNPPPLELSIRAPDNAWSEALGRIGTEAMFEDVRQELRSLGEAIPRAPATDPKAPVLLVEGGWAVIARSEETARKILTDIPAAATPTGTQDRVTASRIQPGTIFSWLELPANGVTSIPASAGLEAAVLSTKADQTLARGRGPSAAAGPPEPLLLVGRKGRERYVVMGGAAATAPSENDPLKLIAQIRSVCWAARYVAEGGVQDLADEDGLRPSLGRNLQAGPLITGPDLQEASARAMAGIDKVVVLITGFYLALMLCLILQNTPS